MDLPAQALVAIGRAFVDAGFGGINLVQAPVLRRSKIRHHDIGANRKSLLAAVVLLMVASAVVLGIFAVGQAMRASAIIL